MLTRNTRINIVQSIAYQSPASGLPESTRRSRPNNLLSSDSALLLHYSRDISTTQNATELYCSRSKRRIIAAGIGSGKMALNILLDDPSNQLVTITISPLKQLQATQEGEFNVRYRIPAVVINEDTPRDDKWWSVRDLLLICGFI